MNVIADRLVLRCNDPRCSRNACTVATVEDGHLVILARHRGEKHRATISLAALARITVDNLP